MIVAQEHPNHGRSPGRPRGADAARRGQGLAFAAVGTALGLALAVAAWIPETSDSGPLFSATAVGLSVALWPSQGPAVVAPSPRPAKATVLWAALVRTLATWTLVLAGARLAVLGVAHLGATELVARIAAPEEPG